MNIDELRNQIDKIDDEMLTLFQKRMNASAQIAEIKKESGKAVLNRHRENEILSRLLNSADNELHYYVKTLYSTIFNLSRSYQNSIISDSHQLSDMINEKVRTTNPRFPGSAVVACQGIEGAYSQIACEKFFEIPSITFFNSFDAVFHAVEKGLCRYGVLPIENSSNGSVTQVYDLMKERNFYIVKSISLKIDHCLLAKPGTNIKNVKKIFSHEQAIAQCSKYVEELKDVEIHICENTAVAAKAVADSCEADIAALSSRECAALYELSMLDENIQNTDNNYTRFICISKDLEIYPGADKFSIMLTIPHRPGSLFELMSKFAAAGLNLTKLESRPIAGRDFEFLFYFDFEASIYSESALSLMDDLSESLEQFKFLGSYIEK